MVRIRKVEICNFHLIRFSDWCPLDGVNCPKRRRNSEKSTNLDVIEFCLGTQCNLVLGDTEFSGYRIIW